jgi:hypothetical protein
MFYTIYNFLSFYGLHIALGLGTIFGSVCVIVSLRNQRKRRNDAALQAEIHKYAR